MTRLDRGYLGGRWQAHRQSASRLNSPRREPGFIEKSVCSSVREGHYLLCALLAHNLTREVQMQVHRQARWDDREAHAPMAIPRAWDHSLTYSRHELEGYLGNVGFIHDFRQR